MTFWAGRATESSAVGVRDTGKRTHVNDTMANGRARLTSDPRQMRQALQRVLQPFLSTKEQSDNLTSLAAAASSSCQLTENFFCRVTGACEAQQSWRDGRSIQKW